MNININKHLDQSIKESVKKQIRLLLEMFFDDDENLNLYQSIITEVEKTLIIETLKHSNFVQSKAAKILGINRNTLRRKILQLKKKNET